MKTNNKNTIYITKLLDGLEYDISKIDIAKDLREKIQKIIILEANYEKYVLLIEIKADWHIKNNKIIIDRKEYKAKYNKKGDCLLINI